MGGIVVLLSPDYESTHLWDRTPGKAWAEANATSLRISEELASEIKDWGDCYLVAPTEDLEALRTEGKGLALLLRQQLGEEATVLFLKDLRSGVAPVHPSSADSSYEWSAY